jgi:hypothetical protein
MVDHEVSPKGENKKHVFAMFDEQKRCTIGMHG